MISSDSSASASCNDGQQLRNVYFLTFSARPPVSPEACAIVRPETAVFRQSRQENSTEWRRQQYPDITSLQTLRSSAPSPSCPFEAHVPIGRPKEQTVEYHWPTEHGQLRVLVLQMIDQPTQHGDSSSACGPIETSAACILVLMPPNTWSLDPDDSSSPYSSSASAPSFFFK